MPRAWQIGNVSKMKVPLGKTPLGKIPFGQNSLWAKLQLSTEQLVVDLLLNFRSDDLVDEEDSVLIVIAVGSSCASP